MRVRFELRDYDPCWAAEADPNARFAPYGLDPFARSVSPAGRHWKRGAPRAVRLACRVAPRSHGRDEWRVSRTAILIVRHHARHRGPLTRAASGARHVPRFRRGRSVAARVRILRYCALSERAASEHPKFAHWEQEPVPPRAIGETRHSNALSGAPPHLVVLVKVLPAKYRSTNVPC